MAVSAGPNADKYNTALNPQPPGSYPGIQAHITLPDQPTMGIPGQWDYPSMLSPITGQGPAQYQNVFNPRVSPNLSDVPLGIDPLLWAQYQKSNGQDRSWAWNTPGVSLPLDAAASKAAGTGVVDVNALLARLTPEQRAKITPMQLLQLGAGMNLDQQGGTGQTPYNYNVGSYGMAGSGLGQYFSGQGYPGVDGAMGYNGTPSNGGLGGLGGVGGNPNMKFNGGITPTQKSWLDFIDQGRNAVAGINRMPFMFSNYGGIPSNPATAYNMMFPKGGGFNSDLAGQALAQSANPSASAQGVMPAVAAAVNNATQNSNTQSSGAAPSSSRPTTMRDYLNWQSGGTLNQPTQPAAANNGLDMTGYNFPTQMEEYAKVLRGLNNPKGVGTSRDLSKLSNDFISSKLNDFDAYLTAQAMHGQNT